MAPLARRAAAGADEGLPRARSHSRGHAGLAHRLGATRMRAELWSHYELGSVSRTSGTLLLPRFSGPPRGSRRTFPGRERAPQGGSPRVREDPLGTPPLSLPRKSSENLEKIPRIWEGEGYWRSKIMNPINNERATQLRDVLAERCQLSLETPAQLLQRLLPALQS
jgi:hypothetical protein